ncbi:MAG: MmcQ/YjbR family DNA-binding protein [Clostridiales bacterium]|nr:MmcQ/YjbR family DNA-binding protein [Clostridiales bacterium]
MTTREEAIRACLTLPFSYEDYPFEDTNWTIIRHLENKKIFAMIFQREGHIWINVKAEPVSGDFWRQIYPAVVPAYHMNKQHWISIILDGSMEEEDILRLVQDSYDLTAPKKKGRDRSAPKTEQA